MITISGRYQLAIRVDGTQVDMKLNSLEELTIFESVIDAVPSIKLILVSDRSLTEDSPIHDGSIIELLLSTLSEEKKEEDWMSFRVFSTEVEPQSHGDRLTISGYLAVPKYFKDSRFEALDMTSRDVAKHIAEESNMDYDLDISDDRQVWIRSGVTGYAFMHQVTRSAYRNEFSAYCLATTRLGELRFYNIGERRNKLQPKWSFVQSDDFSAKLEDNEVLFFDSSSASKSGIFNRFRAYGTIGSKFDVTTGVREQQQVQKLNKSVDALQINKDLLALMRYEYLPFEVGNTHKNFHKAKIQNLHILSTFSSNFKVITNRPKDVHLLDYVEVKSKTMNEGQQRDVENGKYFVDRIVTSVTMDTINVVYNLVREGINLRESNTSLL